MPSREQCYKEITSTYFNYILDARHIKLKKLQNNIPQYPGCIRRWHASPGKWQERSAIRSSIFLWEWGLFQLHKFDKWPGRMHETSWELPWITSTTSYGYEMSRNLLREGHYEIEKHTPLGLISAWPYHALHKIRSVGASFYVRMKDPRKLVRKCDS